MMKHDDLTRLKNVGIARMKFLNDSGITSIKQLHEMPLEKLAEIKSISEHYAKLIKNSISDYYRENSGKLPGKAAASKERKVEKINRNLQKKIKKLRNSLNRVNEDLKPLWEKKYLALYVDFKKRSTKLSARINALGQMQEDLSMKDKKKIIETADAHISKLRKIRKKPKKKKYKKTIREIQSFSRWLRGIIS
jgi:hypothetical protein